VFAEWEKMKKSEHVLSRPQAERQMAAERDFAREWLVKFQELEAKRVAKGQPVDFASTLKALAESGVKREPILETGFFEGKVVNKYAREEFMMNWGLPLFLILVAVLWWARSKYQRMKRARGSLPQSA